MAPTRIGLLVLALIASAGCSLLLDFDELEGHPCNPQGQCELGYACLSGICVATTGVTRCATECTAGRSCDLRIGECVPACEATICPLGSACTQEGGCATVEAAVGAACTSDAQCAGALGACVASPDRMRCACLVPAGASQGVCLGLGLGSEACELCGDADCVTAGLSGAGPVQVCAPAGFRPCASEYECVDPEHPSHCTLLGWAEDPGARLPGDPDPGPAPLGWLSACVVPSGPGLRTGQPCDPASGPACESGLCLPSSAGHTCAVACTDDRGCRGISGGRCTRAPLQSMLPAGPVFDVAGVCAESPSLGKPCEPPAGGCGTDAPLCASEGVCTRPCLDDADCSPEQGFTCRWAQSAGQCR